jgi:hypothetical protein
MIIKTPFGYIDLFQTWEGWTLIGAVVLALAILAWMERGKVRCLCDCHVHDNKYTQSKCPPCHGSGRVRRAWISGLIGRVFHFS